MGHTTGMSGLMPVTMSNGEEFSLPLVAVSGLGHWVYAA